MSRDLNDSRSDQSQMLGGSEFQRVEAATEKSRFRFFPSFFFFILASPSAHGWPLEGQLPEEHAERAAGRADERQAA